MATDTNLNNMVSEQWQDKCVPKMPAQTYRRYIQIQEPDDNICPTFSSYSKVVWAFYSQMRNSGGYTILKHKFLNNMSMPNRNDFVRAVPEDPVIASIARVHDTKIDDIAKFKRVISYIINGFSNGYVGRFRVQEPLQVQDEAEDLEDALEDQPEENEVEPQAVMTAEEALQTVPTSIQDTYRRIGSQFLTDAVNDTVVNLATSVQFHQDVIQKRAQIAEYIITDYAPKLLISVDTYLKIFGDLLIAHYSHEHFESDIPKLGSDCQKLTAGLIYKNQLDELYSHLVLLKMKVAEKLECYVKQLTDTKIASFRVWMGDAELTGAPQPFTFAVVKLAIEAAEPTFANQKYTGINPDAVEAFVDLRDMQDDLKDANKVLLEYKESPLQALKSKIPGLKNIYIETRKEWDNLSAEAKAPEIAVLREKTSNLLKDINELRSNSVTINKHDLGAEVSEVNSMLVQISVREDEAKAKASIDHNQMISSIKQTEKMLPKIDPLMLTGKNFLNWSKELDQHMKNLSDPLAKKNLMIKTLTSEAEKKKCKEMTYSEGREWLARRYMDNKTITDKLYDIFKLPIPHSPEDCDKNIEEFQVQWKVLLFHKQDHQLTAEWRNKITSRLLNTHWTEKYVERRVILDKEILEQEGLNPRTVTELEKQKCLTQAKYEPKVKEWWLKTIDDLHFEIRQNYSVSKNGKSISAINSKPDKKFENGNKRNKRGKKNKVSAFVATPAPKCPLCQESHAGGLKQCPKFLALSPNDRLSTVRQLDHCCRCICSRSTNHLQGCEIGQKYNYYCSKCGNTEKGRKHHTLLHLPVSPNYGRGQGRGGQPPRGGGGRGARGGGGGGGRGGGNSTSQSRGGGSFAARTRFSRGRGRGNNKQKQRTSKGIVCKVKNSIAKILPRSIFTLTSIAECNIKNNCNGKFKKVLYMSDNGSTSHFCDEKAAHELKLEEVGEYSGSVATIQGVKKIVANTYKATLEIKEENKKSANIELIAIPFIGNKQSMEPKLFGYLCKEFNIPTENVGNPSGRISLLIGLKDARLLLTQEQYMKSEKFPDLNMMKSPLDTKYTFVGTIKNHEEDAKDIDHLCFTSESQFPERTVKMEYAHNNCYNKKQKLKDLLYHQVMQKKFSLFSSLAENCFAMKADNEQSSMQFKNNNRCIIYEANKAKEWGSKQNLKGSPMSMLRFIQMTVLMLSTDQRCREKAYEIARQIIREIENNNTKQLYKTVKYSSKRKSVYEKPQYEEERLKGGQSNEKLLEENKYQDKIEKSFKITHLDLLGTGENLPSTVCKTCAKTIQTCPGCRFLSSEGSLTDMFELEKIQQGLSVKEENNKKQLVVDWPFREENGWSYCNPRNSNWKPALIHTKKTIERLMKKGMLETFDQEIRKAIEYGAMEPCSWDPNTPLQFFHVVNYVHREKGALASSTACRVVSDFSFPNWEGKSLNSMLCVGPGSINFSPALMSSFRMYCYAFCADLKKAYWTLALTERSKEVTRFFWLKDLKNVENMDFKKPETIQLQAYRFGVATFGASPSGNFLEVGLRTKIAPEASLERTTELIEKERLVDDILSSFPYEQERIEVTKDMESVLKKYNFSIKEIFFSGKESEEDVPLLGQAWSPGPDEIKMNCTINASRKKRGRYEQDDLSEEQLKNLNITKTVITRVIGQTYGLLQLSFFPVLTGLKIYYSMACEFFTKDKWNEALALKNEELDTKIRKYLHNFIDLRDKIKPMARSFIKENFIPFRFTIYSDGGSRISACSIYLSSSNIKLTHSFSQNEQKSFQRKNLEEIPEPDEEGYYPIKRMKATNSVSNMVVDRYSETKHIQEDLRINSALVNQRSKIQPGVTIPFLELYGILLGLVTFSSMTEYSVYEKMLNKHPVEVIFASDSMVALGQLNPGRKCSCTKVRNTAANILREGQRIVEKCPGCVIKGTHITGGGQDKNNIDKNPADVLSKIYDHPIVIANSNFFREGPEEIRDISFPKPESTCLYFKSQQAPVFQPVIAFQHQNKQEIDKEKQSESSDNKEEEEKAFCIFNQEQKINLPDYPELEWNEDEDHPNEKIIQSFTTTARVKPKISYCTICCHIKIPNSKECSNIKYKPNLVRTFASKELDDHRQDFLNLRGRKIRKHFDNKIKNIKKHFPPDISSVKDPMAKIKQDDDADPDDERDEDNDKVTSEEVTVEKVVDHPEEKPPPQPPPQSNIAKQKEEDEEAPLELVKGDNWKEHKMPESRKYLLKRHRQLLSEDQCLWVPIMGKEMYSSLLQKHKWEKLLKITRNIYKFCSASFRKISKINQEVIVFLSFCKSSQHHFKPKLSKMNLHFMCDDQIIRTLHRDALDQRFSGVDTNLQRYSPVISSQDDALLFRLIEFAHIDSIRAGNLHEIHSGNVLTAAKLRDGIYGVSCMKATQKVRFFILNCQTCVKGLAEPLKNIKSSPRIFRFLQDENTNLFFQYVSLDLSAPIEVLQGKRTVKCYYLICVDIIFKFCNLVIMHSATRECMYLALLQHIQRYKAPSCFISDQGSLFSQSLSGDDHKDLTGSLRIKIYRVGKQAQYLNYSERYCSQPMTEILRKMSHNRKKFHRNISPDELQLAAISIEKNINQRPIFGDSENTYKISPEILVHPFKIFPIIKGLTSENFEKYVEANYKEFERMVEESLIQIESLKRFCYLKTEEHINVIKQIYKSYHPINLQGNLKKISLFKPGDLICQMGKDKITRGIVVSKTDNPSLYQCYVAHFGHKLYKKTIPANKMILIYRPGQTHEEMLNEDIGSRDLVKQPFKAQEIGFSRKHQDMLRALGLDRDTNTPIQDSGKNQYSFLIN